VSTKNFLPKAYAFDGSSIAGWKGIESSDMLLMPDMESAHIDPFFAQTTLAVFCDILEPTTGQAYERDPRSIVKKAEAYMKSTGVGDAVYFGPEAEFFMFDDVRFSAEPYNTGFRVDSTELPSNSGTEYEMGNLGHRPRTKGGYFPVPPIDSALRTSAPKCWPSWLKWVLQLKSITTKSRPRSTSWALNSHRSLTDRGSPPDL
jgi:glutamine synthetase